MCNKNTAAQVSYCKTSMMLSRQEIYCNGEKQERPRSPLPTHRTLRSSYPRVHREGPHSSRYYVERYDYSARPLLLLPRQIMCVSEKENSHERGKRKTSSGAAEIRCISSDPPHPYNTHGRQVLRPHTTHTENNLVLLHGNNCQMQGEKIGGALDVSFGPFTNPLLIITTHNHHHLSAALI